MSAHPLFELEQPYSPEAEQAVLGGLMIDNDTWDSEIAEKLSENDFYTLDHRVIFRAIAHLARENKPIDVVTVTERVKALSSDANPDLAYIGALAQNVPTAANISHYADIVRERANLRCLVKIGFDCTRNAAGKLAKSGDVQEAVEQALFALSQHRLGRDFADVRQGLCDVIDTIEKHYESGDPVTGVTTSLTDLDKMTSGLQPSDLIIVAARPSMGKTGLAIGLVRSVLDKYQEGSVQFYSLEMTDQQILFRLLSHYSHIPVQNLMKGELQEDDWERLTGAIGRIHQASDRLALDDSPALTPTALRAKARRAARKFGAPKLIVVDYLQLMRTDGKAETRNLEITEITASLKALAKEMKCPVVALSQLNRGLEQRANKRPVLSDLRDSGAIEQDADLIAFIYRDEFYNPASQESGTAEIIIGKQRNGPTGVVRTAFLSDQARFDNFTQDYWRGRS
ncbi:MAG: replicative DNA helicase [Burkholderiales bacterium]|jgi:replicative DNA helicase|nr:replicative DNA helicase [Burkholderiales bacterium]